MAEKHQAALGVPAEVSAALRVTLATLVSGLTNTTRVSAVEACDHLMMQLEVVKQHHEARAVKRRKTQKEKHGD